MTAIILILGLLGGLWAARHERWAAYPLLASAALTSFLSLAGVGFDLGLWLMIDAAAIVAIEAGPVGRQERVVRSLFIPVFILYQSQPEGWRQMIELIVATQFFIITPWDRLELRNRKVRAA